MSNLNKYKWRHALSHTGLMVALCAAGSNAGASELVYFPLNPSFGGSPLNGQVLLNSALATNKHKAPDIGSDRYGIEEKSPLEQFNDTLERSIISRLATQASAQIIGTDGKFKPGILDTEGFTVTVSDLGDGRLTITTLDKMTGAVNTIEVFQE